MVSGSTQGRGPFPPRHAVTSPGATRVPNPDLLTLLARHRGEAVSKDQIFSEVWSGRAVEEANLNVQISKLRHILDEGRAQGSCIQTITGYGYRFVEGGPPTGAPPPSAAAGDDNGKPDQAVAITRPPGFQQNPAGVAPRGPHSPRVMRHGAALSALGIVVLLMTSVDWRISWLRASRPEAPPQSIVVLPFADLSDDQKQQNLADGIVQDLTTDLSRAGQITVIARSTAAAYGHKSPDREPSVASWGSATSSKAASKEQAIGFALPRN